MLTGQLEVMEKTTQRAAQANGTSASEEIVVGGTKQDRDREGEVKSLPILCSPFSEILMVLLIILMLSLEKEGKSI